MNTAVELELPRPRTPPILRSFRLGGTLAAFRSDPLGFVLRTTETHGDLVQFSFGPRRLCLVRHPDHVKHVLVDANQRYDKNTRGYNKLRLFLGNGLLTSEGDFWRRQRRIAQPAFHRKRIAGFADTMAGLTATTVEDWLKKPPPRRVDMADEMMGLTLRIAAETLLGSDVQNQIETVREAVGFMNRFANKAMFSAFTVPHAVPTPENRRYHRCARELDRIVDDIIAARRRDSQQRGDLLSMLMHARDEETGEGMTDKQLRDEVMTMFLAGHETTANALSWTFYLLSLHPGTLQEVHAEIDRVLGGRLPTAEDVRQLALTERVVKESMRLYPPAWSIGRNSLEQDVIGGYRIDPGTMVLLSPYATQRHPAFWHNPEGFNPDRFLPEHEKSRPRMAYFPFGGGPRLCIGQSFAMLEAVIVVATVLQRVRPALVPGHPVVPQPLVTLRPKHGVQMNLEPAS